MKVISVFRIGVFSLAALALAGHCENGATAGILQAVTNVAPKAAPAPAVAAKDAPVTSVAPKAAPTQAVAAKDAPVTSVAPKAAPAPAVAAKDAPVTSVAPKAAPAPAVAAKDAPVTSAAPAPAVAAKDAPVTSAAPKVAPAPAVAAKDAPIASSKPVVVPTAFDHKPKEAFRATLAEIPGLYQAVARRRAVRAKDLITKQELFQCRNAIMVARSPEIQRQILKLTYVRLGQRAWERGMVLVEAGHIIVGGRWNNIDHKYYMVEPVPFAVASGHPIKDSALAIAIDQPTNLTHAITSTHPIEIIPHVTAMPHSMINHVAPIPSMHYPIAH